MASMVVLHRITREVTSAYKEVRLRALRDSPSAFGSLYLRESQFTEEEWSQRVKNVDGEHGVGYLALGDVGYGGVAACLLDKEDPRRAQLVSMWVAPELRRSGVGRMLVDAVEVWAAGRGAGVLSLMTTSSNYAAMQFYERIGFSRTGRTEPYPNDPELVEFEMSKAIG